MEHVIIYITPFETMMIYINYFGKICLGGIILFLVVKHALWMIIRDIN